MNKPFIAFLALSSASISFGTNLVTNGNFETLPLGTGWAQASSGGFLPLIGDYSSTVVTSGGGFGPATNTAALGGYDSAIDSVTQSISTVTGATSAFLDFDFYYVNEDAATFDFLDVTLGSTNLMHADLGDALAVTLNGPIHKHINVLSLMDGSAKNLAFTVTTDSSIACSAFIDNVSLNVTTVPEPASFAVLGLGALALVRRRKKA